ncbi:MAG: GNAT family N-acetyltransferase [Agathobacter sp.]|nr:GNAT family N-acetyltransferase [Agathobacter sp.]
MNLRKLELKDAPLMLEWMHDDSVVHYMGANFAEKTLVDCEKFIQFTHETEEDLHMAVVDDSDEYMGTVSLKHINKELKMAEFAITVRKCAMGQGYSGYGMKEIIRIGLEELGLDSVIWCVSKVNERAVRFYDKNGYQRITDVPEVYVNMYTEEQNKGFIWYEVRK